MAKFKELGIEVKDKITGFTGMLVGHADYLTGCDQYLVQPECENSGTYPSAEWFDEGRLIKIKNAFTYEDVSAEKNGCDYVAPTK